MTAGMFVALLIIQGATIWMAMDIGRICNEIKNIRRLLEKGEQDGK